MSDASLAQDRAADTTCNDDVVAASRAQPLCVNQLATVWSAIEHRLVQAGDWLNPILVKETRQALKSWQFTITFVLLLVACWVVTIGGVALIGPSVYYAAGGGELLMAYYVILAFPLAVIVPYSAFRSLAAEREDNTYDLLSITALQPRQIISGKLGSAIVQMAVYFSAITPCLAFTYLLRGVDMPTILLLLGYTFLGSLALSMVGVLLATLSRQRYGQVILSVAFVALLLVAFWIAIVIAVSLTQLSYVWFGNEEFWVAHVAFGSLYVTTFALAYLAASAMITFPTENRSTPLRVAMLIQQACWVGWMLAVLVAADLSVDVVFVMALLGGIYWYAMGTMLTGEQREMSRRVMRRLPKSKLGRVLFTWFNPGPGAGYMFAVANIATLAIICLFATWIVAVRRPGGGWPGATECTFFVIIGSAYLIAYLGLGRLLIAQLRRFTMVTMFAGVLIQVLLVLAGSGIPTAIQLMSIELRNAEYSYLQVTNPIWSLNFVADNATTEEAARLLMVVPAAAICVLLLNLPSLVRELHRVRVALPTRVAQDEAELHPEPVPGPSNPWEEEVS